MAFDVENLTTAAAMNRFHLVAVPGADPEVRDNYGYHMLSSEYLVKLIRAQSQALALPTDLPDRDIPRWFQGCFEDDRRAAALPIARRYGRNLGFLLLALRRGDAVNRAARADWNDVLWEYWANVRGVYIGGGLSLGPFGAAMLGYARDVLIEGGYPTLLEAAPYGSLLPLVGAARGAAPDVSRALVFDFGGSFIKRAVVHYADGALQKLTVFPPLPSICASITEHTLDCAVTMRDHMLDSIEQTRRDAIAAGFPLQTERANVLVSLACYVAHGYFADRGCYGVMGLFGEPINSYFAAHIGERWNQSVTCRFFHDGTAGAAVFSGRPNLAVLVLGTAIGIGYPSPQAPHWSIAPDFAIDTL